MPGHNIIRRVRALLGGLLLAVCMPGTSAEAPPPITESFVMLYYRELGPARAFYADVLGLEATAASEGFALFRIAPGSSVGLIREGPDAYHRVQARNAVMLSIVTTDVDAWFRRVSTMPGVKILKPVYEQKAAGIRGFLIEDPGGYTIEIFQWTAD
jgi:predicted enzyme related to lactoylglutathione lyase